MGALSIQCRHRCQLVYYASCSIAQYCQFTFTDEVPLVGTVY